MAPLGFPGCRCSKAIKLQFGRRFDVLSNFHGMFAIFCKAGEDPGQRSELVARKHAEQCIVDGTLKSRKSCQSADTLTGNRELNPATVAWMHAFLNEAVGHQLVDLICYKGAA